MEAFLLLNKIGMRKGSDSPALNIAFGNFKKVKDFTLDRLQPFCLF